MRYPFTDLFDCSFASLLFAAFLFAVPIACLIPVVRHVLRLTVDKILSLFRGRVASFAAIACCVILALVVIGCQTQNAATYQTENLLADTAISATHSFNLYAASQETNGPIQSIEQVRTNLYAADVRLYWILKLADTFRLQAITNGVSTNTPELAATLQQAANESSNIAATVKFIVSGK